MIDDVMFTLCFFAFVAGCWMAWPPLGLIIPSSLIMGLLLRKRGNG